MELDTNFEKVFCLGNPEEKKAIVPVDCTIILPDYFPDVMKILRYTAKTVKSPVLSEPGGETVSGTINIEVSYISEEGELCSCSQLQPFSHVFESKGKINAAEAEVSVGEIGCRAVNKRRIDLHGNIEIILKTVFGEEKSFVSSVKGEGAVCKNKSIEAISFIGEFYKNFTLEEKGELGYGKPPFGKILRSSVFAEVEECHVIQDKIVTKGEIKVNLLWTGEENENEEKGPFLSVLKYPVSRMVDAAGISQSDICDACYRADFPEITPSDDGSFVNVKVKVGIFARVYRKSSFDIVEDMFSTDYETKADKTKFSVVSEAVPVFAEENFTERFDLPESAKNVLDMWTETGIPEISAEGKIITPGKICMFAKDEDENPLYFEKSTEIEIPFAAKGKETAFYNISSGIKSEEFNVLDGGKAEISGTVLIDGTVYASANAVGLTSCSLDTEKKIEHGFAAMTLCFAEKGEHIWDIAKKYRASAKSIMEENGLLEEVLSEKTMIVITG